MGKDKYQEKQPVTALTEAKLDNDEYENHEERKEETELGKGNHGKTEEEEIERTEEEVTKGRKY